MALALGLKMKIGNLTALVARVLETGLKAWHKFTASAWTGSNRLPDSSGNSNTAALYTGRGLSFDGVNDVVTVGATGVTVKSVVFYAYPDTTTQAFMQLQSTGAVRIEIASGTLSATGFTSPTLYVNGAASSTVAATTWQQIAVTSATGVSASNVLFGQSNTTFLSGDLSNVKFFSIELSAAQIAELYANPEQALPTGASAAELVGWWQMAEKTGNNMLDSSNSRNHRELSGATRIESLPSPLCQNSLRGLNIGALALTGSAVNATTLAGVRGGVLSANGNYCYVLSYTNTRLTIVDVSNPASPTVTGSVSDATNLNGGFGLALSANGNYCYVAAAGGNRLTVVDVSNPASPTVAGSVNNATSLNFASSVSLSANGNYCYVTAYSGARLTVVDVTTPASPTIVGSLNDATNLPFARTSVVSANGTYCYVAAEGGKLAVVNVSNPASPTLTGSVTTSAAGVSLSANGNYCYVTGYAADKLTVIDVTTPASPTVVGSIIDSVRLDGAVNVATSTDGKFAYVANDVGNGMTVIDVANPASPSIVKHLTNAVMVASIGVCTRGNYCYVSSRNGNSLAVLNVQYPAEAGSITPQGLGSTDVFGTSLVYQNNSNLILNSSGYASITDAATLDITSAITLEAWIKPFQVSAAQTIIGKNNAYALNITSGAKLQFQRWSSTASGTVSSSASLVVDTWKHVCAVYNGTTTVLYFNGVQDTSSGSVTGAIDATSTDVLMGALTTSTQLFSGYLDSVKVYDAALTASQVLTNYNAEKSEYGL